MFFDILSAGRIYTMSHPYTGNKKIKEIIYRLLEPTLEQQGWYLSKLMMNWETLIGNQWKDHIRPVRFAPNIKDRSQGTLHVKVTHMGMQQVLYTKGFLIEKLNLFLGCTAVIDIRPQLWHQAQPIIKKEIKLTSDIKVSNPLIDNVQDHNLKDALQELGAVFSARR